MSEESTKEELSNLEKINELLREKAVLTEQEIARLQSLGQINNAYFENLRREETLISQLAAERAAALTEEGKLQELSEMKIADLEAKLKVSQEENTRLNRDNVVASALAGLDFRNERSRQLAYRDIVEQLVQNENGSWIHKSSGSNIQDFVVSYSNNEENSFLFRVKANSGAGISNPSGISNTDTKKSLAEMSTQEVLNLAAKGQLGNFNY